MDSLLLQLPFRATVLSTLLAILFIVMGTMTRILDLSVETGAYSVSIMSLIVVVFRIPVVTAILFRSNEINVAASREEERERKREIELKEALAKRRVLRNKRENLSISASAIPIPTLSNSLPAIEC